MFYITSYKLKIHIIIIVVMKKFIFGNFAISFRTYVGKKKKLLHSLSLVVVVLFLNINYLTTNNL
jgi:hypothetical protein